MKLKCSRRKPKDQGAALVLVLWGAIVMSIIAAAAARQASTTAITVNASAELTRARALADGGVRAGWTAFAEGRVNDMGAFWGCYIEDDLLLVRLRPETSRIDINLAEPELLAALFVEAGADRATADGIAAAAVEYRNFGDTSDDSELPEDADTRRLPDGLFVRGLFQSIEELGYLPGMDSTLYRRIAGDVSVHARTPDVDARYASPVVRAALGSVGLPVAAEGDADANGDAGGFEGSLMDVRAIAVTRSGAVFVREAVVEGPIDSEGPPRLLRLAQGRLADGEVLPDGRGAPACDQGFAMVGRTG
jgi:general secretion pathway protein K